MDCNFLIGTEGDGARAVLAAVSHNFARLRAWLRQLWRALLAVLAQPTLANPHPDAG